MCETRNRRFHLPKWFSFPVIWWEYSWLERANMIEIPHTRLSNAEEDLSGIPVIKLVHVRYTQHSSRGSQVPHLPICASVLQLTISLT